MAESTLAFQLSPQQENLWASGREPAIGNAVSLVLLEGLRDAHRLHTAVQEIVARHEALRTVFRRATGM